MAEKKTRARSLGSALKIDGEFAGNELERLQALHRYQALDAPSNEIFDDLTRLAAYICKVPIALITFVGANKITVKSSVGGGGHKEVPRDFAYCSKAIYRTDVTVVSDTLSSKETSDNMAVKPPYNIRFYASAPIVNPEGYALGTLCIMDHVPRDLDLEQKEALRFLAHQAMTQLELRRHLTELNQTIAERKRAEEEVYLLQTMVREVGESADLDAALQVTLRTVCESAGWVLGQAWLPDPAGEFLEYSAAWCVQSGQMEGFRAASEGMRIRKGEGLPGQAWFSRQPVWLQNVTQTPAFRRLEEARKAGLHTGMAVPVLAGDDVVAVLEFFVSDKRERDERMLRLATTVGAQLGRVFQQKRADQALRESEERYALAARGVNDGLWDWDLKTNNIYYSPRWKSILGFEEDELVNTLENWLKRVHPEDTDRVMSELTAHLEGLTPHFQNEHRLLHKHGTYRWVLSRGIAVRDPSGKAYRMAGSNTDITERKGAEGQLLFDALHDVLTKLPNRALFMDRLGTSIARSRRRPQYVFAVLFLDLDRFKVVNDSLGHTVGDELLLAISRRLENCLRPGDTVSRFGGDEFAILLDDIRDVSDATRIADRILSEIRIPFNLRGQEVFTTASIGVAISESGYSRPEDLLRDADTAMYRAKALGRGRYEMFDTTMHAKAVVLLELEADLRKAMGRNEFRVHYQPIISLKTGKIAGAEALLRWAHPERGLVPPSDFIPLAEETGLIVAIGEWLLKTACVQNRAWRWDGNPNLRLSVNCSAIQFEHRNLPRVIERILRETRLEPEALELEITESIAMKQVELTKAILKELNSMGIRISIDDFGTGYSSLGSLTSFPINTLKINQTFLGDLRGNSNDAAVTRSIINLAHSLDLQVVAEGVETGEQLEFLRAQQCDEIQGYLFSRPIPPEEFAQLLKEDRFFVPASQ